MDDCNVLVSVLSLCMPVSVPFLSLSHLSVSLSLPPLSLPLCISLCPLSVSVPSLCNSVSAPYLSLSLLSVRLSLPPICLCPISLYLCLGPLSLCPLYISLCPLYFSSSSLCISVSVSVSTPSISLFVSRTPTQCLATKCLSLLMLVGDSLEANVSALLFLTSSIFWNFNPCHFLLFMLSAPLLNSSTKTCSESN